jgi:hypothetical protein
MGAPQAKYAIIRIPIGLNTEDTGKNTKLYFTAEDNNTPVKEQADALRAEEVPLEVNKTVNFIDGATWFSGNPFFCIWWDKVIL